MPMAPGAVVRDVSAAGLAGALLSGVGAAVAPWKFVVAGAVFCANAPANGMASTGSARKSPGIPLLMIFTFIGSN